jgi:hypothetical protein
LVVDAKRSIPGFEDLLTNQGIQIMKTLISLTLAASAIASPALSFAQSSVTRAQVNEELAQLVRAGYDPSAGENVHYPDDILAAEAKVAQQGEARPRATSVGGTDAGATVSQAAGNEAR